MGFKPTDKFENVAPPALSVPKCETCGAIGFLTSGSGCQLCDGTVARADIIMIELPGSWVPKVRLRSADFPATPEEFIGRCLVIMREMLAEQGISTLALFSSRSLVILEKFWEDMNAQR